MKNFEYCAYTYRHRKALVYVINYLIKDENFKKELLKRAESHDMDKMFLYQFFEKPDVHDWHRKHASHHMNQECKKSELDLYEAILDYECAGYTKLDKPLNAYDTIQLYNFPHKKELLKVTEKLGINYSYKVSDDKKAMEYFKQFEHVTEQDIIREIVEFMRNCTQETYDELIELSKKEHLN